MKVFYVTEESRGDGCYDLSIAGWYYLNQGQLQGPFETAAQAWDTHEATMEIIESIGI